MHAVLGHFFGPRIVGLISRRPSPAAPKFSFANTPLVVSQKKKHPLGVCVSDAPTITHVHQSLPLFFCHGDALPFPSTTAMPPLHISDPPDFGSSSPQAIVSFDNQPFSSLTTAAPYHPPIRRQMKLVVGRIAPYPPATAARRPPSLLPWSATCMAVAVAKAAWRPYHLAPVWCWQEGPHPANGPARYDVFEFSLFGIYF